MRKKEHLYTAPQITDECYIRRMTLDEAMPILERYINDAFMSGTVLIKIVHGKSGGNPQKCRSQQTGKSPW